MSTSHIDSPAVGATAVADDTQLSAIAMGALRSALQAMASPGESDASRGGLREALRALSMDARGRALHAEQLLVALKRTWVTVPAVQELAPDSRRALLDQVITLAIQAYYETPATPGPQ